MREIVPLPWVAREALANLATCSILLRHLNNYTILPSSILVKVLPRVFRKPLPNSSRLSVIAASSTQTKMATEIVSYQTKNVPIHLLLLKLPKLLRGPPPKSSRRLENHQLLHPSLRESSNRSRRSRKTLKTPINLLMASPHRQDRISLDSTWWKIISQWWEAVSIQIKSWPKRRMWWSSERTLSEKCKLSEQRTRTKSMSMEDSVELDSIMIPSK